jgi:hypothetical protein
LHALPPSKPSGTTDYQLLVSLKLLSRVRFNAIGIFLTDYLFFKYPRIVFDIISIALRQNREVLKVAQTFFNRALPILRASA